MIIVCCRDREGLSGMKTKDTRKEQVKWLIRQRCLLRKPGNPSFIFGPHLKVEGESDSISCPLSTTGHAVPLAPTPNYDNLIVDECSMQKGTLMGCILRQEDFKSCRYLVGRHGLFQLQWASMTSPASSGSRE